MPIDPYAALHALLRAEAVRNAPTNAPTTEPDPESEDRDTVEEDRQRPQHPGHTTS